MLRHLLCATLITICVFANAKHTPTQLPNLIRPTHYDVSITPNADTATFTAQVSISIDVLRPTSSITLNAVKLLFHDVTLSTKDNEPITATNITLNAETQTATFDFAQTIAPGTYTLAMDYSGIINTQANGLFFIDYNTASVRKRALYTQFEAGYARQFIPCWDEPAYKATFTLEATIPSNEMAVSNMPVVSRKELPKNRSYIRFSTTPKMSTYLLFFGLGDFERATAQVENTEIGVITQKGVVEQAQFALAASKEILRAYNDYFGTPYPLPKLDNIAAPGRSQFFSAMENWGAIFTFEHSLLLDPENATQQDKERSFIIVAHEMAHQWFGDLVTMRWWDDLWLNEGFASWMESRTTERMHPEWATQFYAVYMREAAMRLDAFATTHPVVQRVDTVEQASQAFDSITYQKGAAIIGMLENYVGPTIWRNGVRRYMKAHAYGNTTSDDLWQAIEGANAKSKQNYIAAIAHDFTLQPGVPMINVDQVICNKNLTTVHLTQGEFSIDHPDRQPLTWRVPVTAHILTSAEPTPSRTVVKDGKATMHLKGCGPVVMNAGQAGYFRTHYAPQPFSELVNNFSAIAPLDQLGILSDTWALGLAGAQPLADFLNLANGLPLNADPYVWSKINDVYRTIYLNYQGNSTRQQQFSRYAIARLTPVMNHIGWNQRPTDSTAVINLREQLIDVLSLLGDTNVIAEAKRRYVAQGAEFPADFPVELRKAIRRVIALNANTATWDELHVAAKAEKSSTKKDELYTLLASSKDTALATRALQIAITDEPGTTLGAGMISKVAYLHPDLAFDFAIAHLATVHKLIDGNARNRFIPALADDSVQPAMVDKLNAYAKAHIPPSALSSTERAIANINYQIKVRTHRLPQIDAWLDEVGLEKR